MSDVKVLTAQPDTLYIEVCSGGTKPRKEVPTMNELAKALSDYKEEKDLLCVRSPVNLVCSMAQPSHG